MNDEARVDALLRLQLAARERFRGRQQIKWRMNFGIWAAMLAIAAGMTSKDYSATNAARLVVVGGAVAIIIVHLFWNLKITQLLENDRWWAREYAEEAESLVRAKYTPPKDHPAEPRKVRLDWGTGVGCVVTIMLAAMAVAAALGGTS